MKFDYVFAGSYARDNRSGWYRNLNRNVWIVAGTVQFTNT